MDKEYDIMIVGTGAAGLFAALSLPSEKRILMITKDKIENSDSYLAQGGISVLRDDHDYGPYFQDTMKAGRKKNNPETVKIMIQESRGIIQELVQYGVAFDKGEDGELSYTREGGHSIFRILHHKDVTGKEITTKLIEAVSSRKHITVLAYTTMIDLIEHDGKCLGIVAAKKDGEKVAFLAKTTILATGGIGGLFESSTNFKHISGDGFAIALRHNIELQDIEYIQIHPTTLYSKKAGRRFLISESVRGEGAILLNERKERFVDELLPRDVVTAAIKEQMEKFHTEYVYLRMKGMTKREVKQRFPTIYQTCKEEGYDLAEDLIPVTPAQHYLMGGIKTDSEGRTSMRQLYVIGESACNGVHGANRLASNSLLESLVFAKRAAKRIAESITTHRMETCDIFLEDYADEKEQAEDNKKLLWNEIKRRDGAFYDKWCDGQSTD